VKRLFHVGCASRPEAETYMSKDMATLKLVEAFMERYPDGLITMSYLGRMGRTWNYIISVSDNERINK